MKITILVLLPPPSQQELESCLQASSAWLHTPSPYDTGSQSGQRHEQWQRELPPGVGQN